MKDEEERGRTGRKGEVRGSGVREGEEGGGVYGRECQG